MMTVNFSLFLVFVLLLAGSVWVAVHCVLRVKVASERGFARGRVQGKRERDAELREMYRKMNAEASVVGCVLVGGPYDGLGETAASNTGSMNVEGCMGKARYVFGARTDRAGRWCFDFVGSASVRGADGVSCSE